MIAARDQWGPFASGIDPAERMARVRAFRVAVHVDCGTAGREATELLRQAERDPAALSKALAAFERLPALPKRRALSTYCATATPVRTTR
jgi:hypothetical protein